MVDDESNGDRPFRAGASFSALEREGIAAATQVAERLASLLDLGSPQADPGAGFSAPGDPADPPNLADLRATVGRSLDLYTRILQSTFEAYADLVEQRLRARGIRLGVGEAESATASGASEAVAAGELWISNDTDGSSGPLRLFVTDGTSSSGAQLDRERVTLDPVEVHLEPASAIPVTVSVDLAGVEPGLYHAFVLVESLPADFLPLTVVVRPSP